MNQFFYVPNFDWGYVEYHAVPVRYGDVSRVDVSPAMAEWQTLITGFT